MTDLLDFWPEADACRDCIRIDADSASDAVALAVHQPMRFKRRAIGAADYDAAEVTEQALLADFLVEKPADGLVIMPMVGNSGTGKSHVIRWLDLQLRHRPDADRRLVIRVPKGRSLKGVLADILEQVQGPQYERFREQLAKAQERLRPREAAGYLCEGLAQTILAWSTHPVADSSASQSRLASHFATYGAPNFLPALLRNNFLRAAHWERTEQDPGPILRLIAHVFEERARAEEDDRKSRFVADDLCFDEVDASELGVQERTAITWLASEETRGEAVTVLNAALDGAKHRLLGLDPSVNDLFREIRHELLGDGKELVLLIEDFAVLSGLQGALLQVIILDSFRGDKQVLCTMRTALAYTHGYMDTDTVLTRAKREYYIPDDVPDEASTMARIEALVAAYLNASRVGLPRLREAFLRAVRDRGAAAVENPDWVPRMHEPVAADALARLRAFGASADGTPLFPFNHRAVRAFALDGCQRNGKLVYNPRLVISNVLLKVLDFRHAFQGRDFPSERLGDRRPESALAQWAARNVPPQQQRRALVMLTYWGYGITSEALLTALDPRLADTFGVSWKLEHHPAPRPDGLPEKGPSPPEPPAAEPRDAARSQWQRILKAWREGTEPSQRDANEVRNRVAEALCGSIDWGWWLQKRQTSATFSPAKQLAANSWLPNARQAPSAPADSFVVVTDDEMRDHVRSAETESELLAVMLFHEPAKSGGGTWDYDRGEEDAALYAAFVDRLAPRAARWLAERPLRLSDAWDPVPMLVRGLLVGARVLQIPGAATRDHAALVQALFETGPAVVAAPEDGEWRQVCAKLAAVRVAARTSDDLPAWQDVLATQVGGRQGGGGTVFAVDASRLKTAIERALDAADLVADWPRDTGARDGALPANKSLQRAKDLAGIGKAASAERARLETWLAGVQEQLGASFTGDDKAQVVEAARHLVTDAKGAALLGEADAARARDAIRRFEKTPAVEAIDSARKAIQAKSLAELLSALGAEADADRQFVASFCARLSELQSGVASQLEKREGSINTQLNDAFKGLRAQLDNLATVLQGWPLDAKEGTGDVT